MAFNDLYIKEIKLKDDINNEKSYIKKLPVVNNLDRIQLSSNVTFFVGENGSGKSTLLEAIAVNCGFKRSCDDINISIKFNTVNVLKKAKTKEKQDFYAMLSNLVLKRKAKKVIGK